jgi:hypothetical protein
LAIALERKFGFLPRPANERCADAFAKRASRFYISLASPRVPRGVEVMNPYVDARIQRYVRAFLDRYFSDNRERTLILGINPGRFGAGITGVTFTDPVALADECGISNELPRKRELSSVFIYSVINHLGGPAAFFRRFFLSAVCPLGFTRRGINLNYYDDRKLERAVTPLIASSIEAQIGLGCGRDRVIVLGSSQNARFLNRLNDQHRWFESVHALDHPRFILQYRRKQVDSYIRNYEDVLAAV